MVLKVSMPSTSGYASSAQNLSNIAAIIQNQRTAQADREAAANTKIFRQQQLQQGNERLDLARSEQAYAQGADERAIVTEQGIFNRDKARRMEANRGITSILNGVKNDPTQAYTPNAEVDQALLNSPGYKSMVDGVTQTGEDGNQTAGHLDALIAQEDMFQGRRDEVASHPNLFRDPKQITQDVARRARETGNYDETQIQAMQKTALADAGFGSLSPETQKQLFAEQEKILEYGSKLYGGGAGGNTTNNFGNGGSVAGATSYNDNKNAYSDLKSDLNIPEGKGGLKWLSEALSPESIGPIPLNLPDASMGEIRSFVAASKTQSKVADRFILDAMRANGAIRSDGTFPADVKEMIANTGLMANIKKDSLLNQAAASKQRVGGASGQSLANSQGMGKLLSNYNKSNAAIHAAGTPTKRTLAQSLQDAGNYATEQTGVAADFGLGKSASTKAPKFGGGESDLIDTGNEQSVSNREKIFSTAAKKKEEEKEVSNVVSEIASIENLLYPPSLFPTDDFEDDSYVTLPTDAESIYKNAGIGGDLGIPMGPNSKERSLVTVRKILDRMRKKEESEGAISDEENAEIDSEITAKKIMGGNVPTSKSTKLFKSLLPNAQNSIIEQAHTILADPNSTKKERKLMVSVLKAANG